jgi:hypothetical protein
MSLRLRKKPPADRPNVNAGQPWSAIDMADLEDLLASGVSVQGVAEYLCRQVGEVDAKLASLKK